MKAPEIRFLKGVSLEHQKSKYIRDKLHKNNRTQEFQTAAAYSVNTLIG
jgi:hypothetical protein